MKKSSWFFLAPALFGSLGAVAMLALGCGDDDDATTPGANTDGGNGGGGGDSGNGNTTDGSGLSDQSTASDSPSSTDGGSDAAGDADDHCTIKPVANPNGSASGGPPGCVTAGDCTIRYVGGACCPNIPQAMTTSIATTFDESQNGAHQGCGCEQVKCGHPPDASATCDNTGSCVVAP